jgi:hypothetical protein
MKQLVVLVVGFAVLTGSIAGTDAAWWDNRPTTAQQNAETWRSQVYGWGGAPNGPSAFGTHVDPHAPRHGHVIVKPGVPHAAPPPHCWVPGYWTHQWVPWGGYYQPVWVPDRWVC